MTLPVLAKDEYDCTVALALTRTVAWSRPNTLAKNEGACRTAVTVMVSLADPVVVLVTVTLSLPLPFLANWEFAADCACDHPPGSDDAPARAAESAADWSCSFDQYQLPTSTANAEAPRSATMNRVRMTIA